MGCYELTSNCQALVREVDRYYKVVLVSEISWAVVVWIVKSSILAFYWRLFSARSRSIRVIIWVLGACVNCWGIAVVSSRLSNSKLVTIGNFESRQ